VVSNQSSWENYQEKAAFCELLKMNNTCLNQIAVEDHDLNDLQDMKGPVEIMATEMDRQNYDDLETWITDLKTTDVVDENELVLFPQLDQPQHENELSQDFLDEFVDFDSLGVGNTTDVQNNVDTETSNIMAEKFDFSAFFQLDKGNIDDEVAVATKLLSEEENALTDMLISYVESESNVNSPEMNHQSVDILLDELIHDTDATATNSTATTNTNFISEILADTTTVQDTITVDCDVKFPDNLCIDENVVNEFADLLNSFDESLTSWNAGQNVPFSTNSSVDYVNTSANLCNNTGHSNSLHVQDYSEQIIDDSVNSPVVLVLSRIFK